MFEITLINGSIIQGIPASEPERYRGKQYHGAWFDELCAFDYIDEAYDGVQFTLRLRDSRIPRVQQIITTTPKPKELIVEGDFLESGGVLAVQKLLASRACIHADQVWRSNSRGRLGIFGRPVAG